MQSNVKTARRRIFRATHSVLVAACGVVLAVSCARVPSDASDDSVAEAAGASSTSPAPAKLEWTPAADDWPWWRGPTHNGIAAAGESPPRSWSDSENVVWKADVPGRGHGSPIVVGTQVVLATADEKEEVQSVLCLDRASGERQWKTDLHRGGFPELNDKASHASSTPACDGERFFINFLNGGAVHTTALSRSGDELWQTEITKYKVHQGYGSSPLVHGSLVIVTADNKSGGALCALRRSDGEVVWRHERPEKPNYASPVVLHVGGRQQLILTGCDLVSGFDPLSGKRLWEVDGATTECVTTAVTDGKLVFSSGGYPRNHIAAVRADGSGELAWDRGIRVYVPSMIVRDDTLHAVADAGVAHCIQSGTGEEIWKARLEGRFTASPTLVGDVIYATSEKGTTSIYKASRAGFELVAENELGDEVYATPAFCGDQIYMRVATRQDGERSERLYCLGESRS